MIDSTTGRGEPSNVLADQLRRRRWIKASGTIASITAATVLAASVAPPVTALPAGVSFNHSEAHKGEDLFVTVGKSLLVTTDPAGKPDMQVLVSNTQGSGKGQREVVVPMGTSNPSNTSNFAPLTVRDNAIVYDINNLPPQVQNNRASNGHYSEKLPIEVEVITTLDGERIDPAKMVNVTGNVEITYRLKNTSAQPMTLTYQDFEGNTRESTVDLPIPFGASTSVTMPPEFADIRSTPQPNQGVSPSGQVMSWTSYLFPLKLLGGADVQEVTIRARAQNASLPSATIQAVPVVLTDQSSLEEAFPYVEMAEGYIPEVYKYAVEASHLVTMAENLLPTIIKYAKEAETDLIRPALRFILSGQFMRDVKLGERYIREAFTDYAPKVIEALNVAQQWDQRINNGIEEVVNTINSETSDITAIVEKIDGVRADIDEYEQTVINILGLVENYGPEVIDTLDSVATWVNDKCQWAEADVKPVLESIASWIEASEGNIQSVIDYINDHSILHDVFGWLVPFLQGIENIEQEIDNLDQEVIQYIDECAEYGPKVVSVLDTIEADIPQIEQFLKDTQNTYIPMLVSAVDFIDDNIDTIWANRAEYLAYLDNPDCQISISGGVHNCGALQISEYAGQLLGTIEAGVENAVSEYGPRIDQIIGLVNQYLPEIRSFLRKNRGTIENIPALIEHYGTYLPMVEGYINDAISMGDEYVPELEMMVASVKAMSERAAAGEGEPGGPTKGASQVLAVYEFEMSGATGAQEQNLMRFGLAGLILLVVVGAATVLYRRSL